MLDRIIRAIQPEVLDTSRLPVVKTWDELSRNVERHVIAHVQVICRSSRPERLVILQVKCSKCGWEGYINSNSRLICPYCRGVLNVVNTYTIEYRSGKIATIDGNVIDAYFIHDARDIKAGSRVVVGYLTWIPRKNHEVPILIVLREVFDERKPRFDIYEHIVKLNDWKERISLLVNTVATVFNIVGLRSHILLLLAQLVSAYGVAPFLDVTELNTAKRWWIHGAIIGDPGTGKSTLVEIVRKCTPNERCVLLSGSKLTLPGLTVGGPAGQVYEGPMLLLDGSPEDFGVLVLEEAHLIKPEILHEIKDALERGEYYRSLATTGLVGGKCRVSLLLVANFVSGSYRGINSLPDWLKDITICDRLDFIAFTFEPERELSREIARRLLRPIFSIIKPIDIAEYIRKARQHRPKVIDPDTVIDKINDYAEKLRIAYQNIGLDRSTARLRESIARIAVAVAKLAFTDITPEVIDYVYDVLESQIDSLNEATIRYVQVHGIPASEYTIRRIVLEVLSTRKMIDREELTSKVCELLEKQFYKCSIEKIDRVLNKLKLEGIIYEPEPGKIRLVTG